MIYSTAKRLILASNSPRRKDFLHDLGLKFTLLAEEIDETPHEGENPAAYVERMAREKAGVVSRNNPESYVLAADTAVCLGNVILGKPVDAEDAVRMLLSLAGRAHVVRSGFCISCVNDNKEIACSVATTVTFSHFNEAIARAYVTQGESLDKAGAYGIQGRGAFLVQKIEGSYTNVVGLPLAEVVAMLLQESVIRIGN
jgi:septum formation protein